MNTNNSVRNNQAFFKDSLNVVYAMGGSTPASFVPTPLSESFTSLRNKFIDSVLRRYIMHKGKVEVSHETLSKESGMSVSAIKIFLKFAEKIGLFNITCRKKQHKANIYELGPLLKDKRIAARLQDVLKYVYKALMVYIDHKADLYGLFNSDSKQDFFVSKPVQNQNELRYTDVYDIKYNTSVCIDRERENKGPVKKIDYCQYKKRKYCKGKCFKEHKEDKLHTRAYLSDDDYRNMQIARWNDWALTEEKYIRDLMTQQEYELFYANNPDFNDQDMQVKISRQAYQQTWNKSKYKNDGASYQNYIGMTKEKRAAEIEKERIAKELKSEAYRKVGASKIIVEDITIAEKKIEEAKKKEPNNYWLQQFTFPGL